MVVIIQDHLWIHHFVLHKARLYIQLKERHIRHCYATQSTEDEDLVIVAR